MFNELFDGLLNDSGNRYIRLGSYSLKSFLLLLGHRNREASLDSSLSFLRHSSLLEVQHYAVVYALSMNTATPMKVQIYRIVNDDDLENIKSSSPSCAKTRPF